MADRTRKLDLLLIDEQKQFADEAYNEFIRDADNRLVGISHVQDASHWTLWKPNKQYTVGDIVRYTNLKSSQYAYCTVAGTTDETEPVNNVTGSIIASGTAKFQVLDIATGTTADGVVSTWLSGAYYKRWDMVYYGDVLYRCTRAHDATTFEDNKDNWQEIFASLRNWKKQTFYNVGDNVLNDGVAYGCKKEHTSDNVFKVDNWTRLFETAGEFSPTKQYYVGDTVKYARNLYMAKIDSKGNFNLANWEKLTDIIKFWDRGKTEVYVNGDTAVVHNTLVTVGNIGTTDLNSNLTPINASIAEHDISALYYPIGSVVRKDGSIYQKEKGNKESDYVTFEAAVQDGAWRKISNNQITPYKSSKQYKAGEMVYDDGIIYVAKVNNSSAVTDTSKWEELGGSGDSGVNRWEPNTKYKVNQLVTYNNIILRVKTAHESTANIELINFEALNAGIQLHDKSKEYVTNSVVRSQDGNIYVSIKDVPSNKEIDDVTCWQRFTAQPTLKDWTANKQYLANDEVVKDGNIYRAKVDNKETAFNASQWERLVKNDYILFNEWKPNSDYEDGQILSHKNLIIKANSKHNSGANINVNSYEVVTAGIPQWNKANYYPAGTMVKDSDGLLYYSIANVINQDLVPTYWEKVETLLDWAAGNQYFKGTVVWYKNDLYRAKESSNDSVFNVTKWEKLTQNGTIKISTWKAGKNYEEGEIVKSYNADTFYYVKNTHTSSTMEHDIGDTPNLTTLNTILDFDGRAYSFGEITRYNGKLYRAKSLIKSKAEFNPEEWDSLDYSEAIRDWVKKTPYEKDSIINMYDVAYHVTSDFTTADGFAGEFSNTKPVYASTPHWREGANYKEGVTVVSEGRLYRCIKTHKSLHGGAGYTDVANKWYQTTYPTPIGLSTNGGGGNGPWQNIPATPFTMPINGALVYELVFKSENWGNAGFGSFKVIQINTDNSEVEIYDGDLPPSNPLKIYDKVKAFRFSITGAHMGSGFFGDTGSLILNDIIPSFKNDNWELIGDVTSISNWQKYFTYKQDNVVVHDSKIYRCKKDHEGETEFKDENWELISGSGSVTPPTPQPQPSGTTIEDWSADKDYNKGDIVIYFGKMYKAPSNISKSTTFQSTWMPIDSDVIANDWQANKKYRLHEVVYYNGILYRAKFITTKPTFDEDDWEKLSKDIVLEDWKPSTIYKKGDSVIYNSGIWRAGETNTSDVAFDTTKWESLSGGSNSGVAGWKQITKLNATGGSVVTINFPETLTFCFPPIDVLMLQPGTANVLMNLYTFDVGDGNRFEYDSNKVAFDGQVHCRTNMQINMSAPVALGSGFICISDEIDFNDYNGVEYLYV